MPVSPSLPESPGNSILHAMLTEPNTIPTLTIVVNGETRRVGANANIASLIEELGLDRRKLAVERNREIVPRSRYEATPLTDRDQIEIVHFIGGG